MQYALRVYIVIMIIIITVIVIMFKVSYRELRAYVLDIFLVLKLLVFLSVCKHYNVYSPIFPSSLRRLCST